MLRCNGKNKMVPLLRGPQATGHEGQWVPGKEHHGRCETSEGRRKG